MNNYHNKFVSHLGPMLITAVLLLSACASPGAYFGGASSPSGKVLAGQDYTAPNQVFMVTVPEGNRPVHYKETIDGLMTAVDFSYGSSPGDLRETGYYIEWAEPYHYTRATFHENALQHAEVIATNIVSSSAMSRMGKITCYRATLNGRQAVQCLSSYSHEGKFMQQITSLIRYNGAALAIGMVTPKHEANDEINKSSLNFAKYNSFVRSFKAKSR